MDLHHGKYQNPLAILASNWQMDGDWGQAEYSNEGEGCVLYKLSHESLSWSEARTLMKQEQASFSDLDALDSELKSAVGVLLAWDDRGFVYAERVQTPSRCAEVEAEIASMNEALARADESDEERAFAPPAPTQEGTQ